MRKFSPSQIAMNCIAAVRPNDPTTLPGREFLWSWHYQDSPGPLRTGTPVRVLKKRLFGFPRGKYKGLVTGVEGGWVRILLTSTPLKARWLLGGPMHVHQRLLVALPSKRRG